jgi:tRNA 2-selenouridine synthase
MELWNADHILPLLTSQDFAFIDVRSELEFTNGSFPGFQNQPILTTAERHIVGLTYKERGQTEAIEEGLRLVKSTKEARVERWTRLIDSSPARTGVICCWRGGLRSKIAQEWVLEKGAKAVRVEGGYKALRSRVLERLESPPPLVVLTGLTGTGKTRLLNQVEGPKIDLEGLANHRGSSFGHDLFNPQPSQATFENRLGLAIDRAPIFLVEDESRMIGQVCLPNSVKGRIQTSPVVILESPIHHRTRFIFDGYVHDPVSRGKPIEVVQNHMVSQLGKIQRHLGGALYSEILSLIARAFQKGLDPEAHDEWIRVLLLKHYDPRYRHAFQRLERPVLYQGEAFDCLQFLNHYFKETARPAENVVGAH